MSAMSLFYVEPLVEDTGTAALTCPHVREDKSIFNCSHHFVQSLSLLRRPSAWRSIHSQLERTSLFLLVSSNCLSYLCGRSGSTWVKFYLWGPLEFTKGTCRGICTCMTRLVKKKSTVGEIFEASTEYHKNLFDALGGSEYGRNWTNLRMPQCQWLSEYPCFFFLCNTYTEFY